MFLLLLQDIQLQAAVHFEMVILEIIPKIEHGRLSQKYVVYAFVCALIHTYVCTYTCTNTYLPNR